MKNALLALIGFYRRFLSPVLGRNCRFHPTCSRYASDALRKHGVWAGGWLSLWRILRCNPWNPSRTLIDPVPDAFKWFD